MSRRRRLVAPPRTPREERPQPVGADWAACQWPRRTCFRAATRRAAAEAPLAVLEVRPKVADGALPVTRSAQLLPRHWSSSVCAPLPSAASAAIGAACTLPLHTAAALLPTTRNAAQHPAAADGLQQLLLLLALLLQRLEDAAKVVIPPTSTAAPRSTAARAARPAATAHRRGRRVMRADKLRRRRHAE